MRRTPLLAAIAALALVLAPALADAAPGRGGSMGSRGSRTYTAPPATNTAPGTAAPMQRSVTQPGTPARATAATAAAAAPSRGMFGGGMMGGLMGGLLGAGLIGMMMGGGFFSGLAGFAGIMGLLLQVGLLAMVIYFAVRFFRRRSQTAMIAGPQLAERQGAAPDMSMMSRTGMPNTGMGGGMPMAVAAPVNILPADYQAFETLLKSIQGAWSDNNEGALRAFTTPEMASYFGEQLSEMQRQNLRNEVRDGKLEQGDLAEAWAEGGQEFATVALRFSSLDVTRDATGRVVEGDADVRSMSTEVWTFVRYPGEAWVLSAIQQTR